jgi:phospholipid-binding lipoprotein MlaA
MSDKTLRRFVLVLYPVLLLLIMTGCAASSANRLPESPPLHSIAEFKDQRFAEVADPWEGFNRDMYRFNFYLDKYFLLPVLHGYEYVAPVFVQDRVSNFYNNIAEIRNLTNSVFQAKGKESLTTLGRFVTNSTLGIGGLFDPATSFGLARHDQDFGKTLGYWGASSGPYIVLPFFGPSSVRDTSGLAVDSSIMYGIYTATGPFDATGQSLAISAGVKTLEGVDMRRQQGFRYYESGYPFEYYMVRFIYHEKRELESKPPLKSAE